MSREYVLYLQVGDRVYHKYFKRWGMGVVVEERRSELPGGFCYARVDFQDGNLRVFDNNLKSECCCYYAGVVRLDVEEEECDQAPRRARNSGASRPQRKALPRGDGMGATFRETKEKR
jgi:hypothetical protein